MCTPDDAGHPPIPSTIGVQDMPLAAREWLSRLLADATERRRLILVVLTPALLSRMSLYRSLEEHISRWGRRKGDIGAFIDLSNHPTLPAQTVIGDEVRTWEDLAEGLPQALAAANILVVLGLEQMLADTPHRLAAFLEARARHQVVVVLTTLADRVCALSLRDTPIHLDDGLAEQSDCLAVAASVAATAIAAARCATRREPGDVIDREPGR